jgi:hypothetical protein
MARSARIGALPRTHRFRRYPGIGAGDDGRRPPDRAGCSCSLLTSNQFLITLHSRPHRTGEAFVLSGIFRAQDPHLYSPLARLGLATTSSREREEWQPVRRPQSRAACPIVFRRGVSEAKARNAHQVDFKSFNYFLSLSLDSGRTPDAARTE